MKTARRKRTPAPKKKPPFQRMLGPMLGLLALAIAAHAPALHNRYVNFDDGTYVIANPLLNDVGGLGKIWTGKDSTLYYPLVFTSFWIEKQIEVQLGIISPDQPPNPYANHAINILLHGLGGIFLWGCLKRLGMPAGLAWVAAAIWITHPLQVQSVVWATERKNTLSGLFCFAATLAWLRSNGRTRSAAYLACLPLYAGALLSKTAFLLLPATWLLLEWLERRPLRAGAVARALPFAGLALMFALFTLGGEHRGANTEQPPMTARLMIAGLSLWFYLWKAVWPVGIVAIYDRWETAVTPLKLAPFILTCVGGLAWAFAALWSNVRESAAVRVILVATGHYVLLLTPTLGLIPFGHLQLSFVLNHHVYLALVGPIVLAVLGAERVLRRAVSRPAAVAVGVVLIGGLASISFARSMVWKDTLTLARDILRATPNNARAYGMYALEIEAERPQEALEKMRRAVELQPDYCEARFELGRMLLAAGEDEPAREHLRASLTSPSVEPRARWLLARMFVHKKDYAAALRELEAVPGWYRKPAAMLDTWARCYSRLGRYDQALAKARQAMQLAQQQPKSYELVASLLLRLNRHGEAISTCDRLLTLEPRSVRGLLLRGQCHLARGNAAAAERDFNAALAIAPQCRPAIEQLRQRAPSRPSGATRPP